MKVWTSGGVPLTYAVVANVLTASAGGNTVFTFTLNPATGAWTFDLEDQLDHPTQDGQAGDDTENELTIDLGAIVQATDADGDTVTGNAGRPGYYGRRRHADCGERCGLDRDG